VKFYLKANECDVVRERGFEQVTDVLKMKARG
jgi:hypothetical protein